MPSATSRTAQSTQPRAVGDVGTGPWPTQSRCGHGGAGRGGRRRGVRKGAGQGRWRGLGGGRTRPAGRLRRCSAGGWGGSRGRAPDGGPGGARGGWSRCGLQRTPTVVGATGDRRRCRWPTASMPVSAARDWQAGGVGSAAPCPARSTRTSDSRAFRGAVVRTRPVGSVQVAVPSRCQAHAPAGSLLDPVVASAQAEQVARARCGRSARAGRGRGRRTGRRPSSRGTGSGRRGRGPARRARRRVGTRRSRGASPGSSRAPVSGSHGTNIGRARSRRGGDEAWPSAGGRAARPGARAAARTGAPPAPRQVFADRVGCRAVSTLRLGPARRPVRARVSRDGEDDLHVDGRVAGDQVGEGLPRACSTFEQVPRGDEVVGEAVDRGPRRGGVLAGEGAVPLVDPGLGDPAAQPGRGPGPLRALADQVGGDAVEQHPGAPPQGRGVVAEVRGRARSRSRRPRRPARTSSSNATTPAR